MTAKQIDIAFMKLYITKYYNSDIYQYFRVARPTVSNWKKRGIPPKYLLDFINREKTDDMEILIRRIYK